MGDLQIVDGFDSHSVLAALSANSGRILYEMITDIATVAEIDAIFA